MTSTETTVTPSLIDSTTEVSTLLPPTYGENFELAGGLQMAFDFLLLLVQLLFIRGARRLCGWNSNFAFTLLVYLAVSAAQCYISDIIAVCCSIFAIYDIINWHNSQRLFRILGSFYGVPQFSIFFVSIWLSLHRCVYVFYPFKATKIFTPKIAKISFAVIIVLHLAMCIFWSTDWMGLRYYPSFFTFSIRKDLPLTNVMVEIGTRSNLLIPINMVLYSLLVIYILVIKRVKIAGNHEIRFTLQAFIVVLLEMGLFVFNYFNVANYDDPWFSVLARTLTQQLYVAFPSITYLLVNSCTCETTIVPTLKPAAYGEHYELAGGLQISFDFLLFLIQILFIRGARPLCGWKSDFSFTLLVYQAVSASQCYISDILAVFSSIYATNKVLNWQRSQRLFRVLGSFYGVPQFSIFFVSVWLSLHRCVYIFFPFRATQIFTPRIAKISLAVIIVVHLATCIFWSTDWTGLRYYPPVFTFSIKAGLPFTDAMIVIATESNLLIPINMALYSLLVVYILVIKRVKIRGNYEVRFTLQAFIVVLLEMGLFVFSYFSEANSADPWFVVLARTLTQQLYVAFPSITYLLVNREVRRGAMGLTESIVSRLPSTLV